MDDFNIHGTRFFNIEEVKPGLFVANVLFGPTAKQPNIVVFTRNPDMNWIGRTVYRHGYRKGTVEMQLPEVTISTRRGFEAFRDMVIRATREFVNV